METFLENFAHLIEDNNLETVIKVISSIFGGIVALIEVVLRLKELIQTKTPKEKSLFSENQPKKVSGLRILGLFGKKKNKSISFQEIAALNEIQEKPSDIEAKRIFISYKVGAHPDHELVNLLEKALTKRGHKPFIHTMLPIGIEWGKSLHQQIEKSDFLLVFLSASSIKSEMVVEEVTFAEVCRTRHKKPTILPVRIKYLSKLPYGLANHLDEKQFALWQDESDTDQLIEKIFSSIENTGDGDLSVIDTPPPPSAELEPEKESKTREPLPSFDPRLLETPTGAVKRQSPYYVRRDCDEKMERQIRGGGNTTTIRAGRQMGKTSLLVRGATYAKEQGGRVVYLDFQQMKAEFRATLDNLLHYLASEITFRLNLDEKSLEKIWSSSRGGPDKFNHFMESIVLSDDAPLLIAIDEADQLMDAPYKTDFFALLRAWDSRRAFDSTWEKLSLALVISTHPHLLIDDYRQSPFNVGLRIQQEDFTLQQVADLNKCHNSPLKDNDLPVMMELLGGHPYLTRQALYSIVDEEIDWIGFQKTILDDPGPFSSHLHFYLWQLRDRPDLVAGMREAIKKNTCSDEKVLYRLAAAGLLKELPDNQCALRCGLYESYFRKTLNA